MNREHKTHSSFSFKMIAIIVLGLLVLVSGIAYTKYEEHQTAKKKQVEQLIEEQQQIIAAQRAEIGDLPNEGLAEKGKANLEHPTTKISRSDIENHSGSSTDKPNNTATYTCDGRTHCSQMRSYEEAVFFNNHCPGTKMDGNNDGIPCERQFNR